MSIGLARLREEPDRIRQGAIDKGEDPTIVDQPWLWRQAPPAARRSDRLKPIATPHQRRSGSDHEGAAPNGPRSRPSVRSPPMQGPRSRRSPLSCATESALESWLWRTRTRRPDVSGWRRFGQSGRSTWAKICPRTCRSHEGGTWNAPSHWEVAETLHMFDLERGAKISVRVPCLHGSSRLQREALIDFMSDVHTARARHDEICRRRS